MINLVEKLETVFFLNLLRQWIKLDEVAKLDTALTSKLQRQAFLELLSKINCKYYIYFDSQLPSRLLIEWMTTRSIPIDSLKVTSDTLSTSTTGIFWSKTLHSLSCSHFWQQELKFGDPVVVSPIFQIFSTIPNLSDIKLTNSKFMTGHNLSINCPHLTNCDFTFLINLTDNFVVNLSKKCPQLTRVVLSQCKLLTDISIVSLVINCKGLSFLHIGGCKKLTVVAFQSIASECTQLTGFNMDYCTKVAAANRFEQQPTATPPENVVNFVSTESGMKPKAAVGTAGGCDEGKTVSTSTTTGVGAGNIGTTTGANLGSVTGSSATTTTTAKTTTTTASRKSEPSPAYGGGAIYAGWAAVGSIPICRSSSVEKSRLLTPILAELSVTGVGGFVSIEKTHEELIIDIVRSNLLLTELYLRNSGVTNKLLLTIAECLSNFRVLDFCDCGQVTDEGLVPLAESCKLLSELIFEPSAGYNTTGVTQKTFLAIATNCPEFKRFRLPGRLISQEVLAKVSINIDCVDLSAWVLDCSHFQTVDNAANETDKSYSEVKEPVLKVKDEVFRLFAPYCTGAHTYRCSYKPHPDDIVLFLEHMPHIKHLDLACAHNELTDKHLIAISKQNVQLESFVVHIESFILTSEDISDSKHSSHIGVAALAKRNPFLTKLDIDNCNNLTDDTLISIAEHCKGLKWLNINRARKATDKGFLSLAHNCCRLQYLDASGCIALTDVGIYSVIARCKELQIFLFNTYRFPDFDLQVKERYEMHFVLDKLARE